MGGYQNAIHIVGKEELKCLGIDVGEVGIKDEVDRVLHKDV